MKQRPIDTSEPAVIDYESEPVTEYPRPMKTPLPFNNLPTEDWPTGKYPISHKYFNVICRRPPKFGFHVFLTSLNSVKS